jgi:hypothetical protein
MVRGLTSSSLARELWLGHSFARNAWSICFIRFSGGRVA